jgi:hypothetical protein
MKKQLLQTFKNGLLLFMLMTFIPISSRAQWVEIEKSYNDELSLIESDKLGNVYSTKLISGTSSNQMWQVRKWDGEKFIPLVDQNKSTFNGQILRIEFDQNGNLYMIGYFTNSNGQYYVAKWDGINWSEIGPSITTFGSIAINTQGEIVVNRFNCNCNINGANIIKWDGSQWNLLIDSSYNIWWDGDLEFDRFDNLYISGTFDNLLDGGGNPTMAFYISKWNSNGLPKLGTIGTNFPDLYNPYKFSGIVTNIELDTEDNLYVVGHYKNWGTSQSLLRWNGNTWSDLGKTGRVINLDEFKFDSNGKLYLTNTRISKYENSNWIDIINPDSVLSCQVNSFGFDENDNIIVASKGYRNSSDRNQNIYTNYLHKYFVSAPILNDFAPKSAFKGDEVTIYGKNLFGVTAVIFGNDTAQSFHVVNDNTLIAIVGKGSSGNIKVINPAGTSILSGFVFPEPIVQSFDPMKSAKGVLVTINGFNFRDVQKVTFGGTPAKSFEVINATTINATVSNGNSGYVSVTTLGGKDSLAGFTFIPAPHITSFTPTSANVGETVTIIGSDFTDASAVLFGGYPAKSFTVLSAGTIQAVVDSGSTGFVSVATPGGADSLEGFTHLYVQSGIEEFAKNKIQVYPNPAQESITIESALSLAGQSYCIYDCIGKLVVKGVLDNQTNTVSLQSLNNGIYTLEIGTKNRQVIKLVKGYRN